MKVILHAAPTMFLVAGVLFFLLNYDYIGKVLFYVAAATQLVSVALTALWLRDRRKQKPGG